VVKRERLAGGTTGRDKLSTFSVDRQGVSTMAVNDLFQVQIFQNVGSELTMNVFHLRETEAVSGVERGQDNAVQIANDLYLLWAEFLSDDWRVTVIKARRTSPAGGIPATVVYGGAEAIVGQVESEIVPSQAAILISLYSDTPDRTGRGRQYIPGCPEASQNEGQLLEAPYNANHTVIETFYESEHNALGAGTGKYRFIVHGGGGSPLPEWDVKVAFIHPNLATQRRRRNFPGFGS